MKNIAQHTGVLEILGRLPQSRNGNPRYALRVDGFYCVTAPDSPHGYSLTNHEGNTVTVTIGTHYGQATLNTLHKA